MYEKWGGGAVTCLIVFSKLSKKKFKNVSTLQQIN